MELFVPGRICLFGEHSDWAGGYRRINGAIEKGRAIIVGSNQGLYARVQKHPSRLIFRSADAASGQVRVLDLPMERQALLEEAEKGGYFSYVAGVAAQILIQCHVQGLLIDNYRTDLPVKKGLSSSAAVCVLTARAFNQAYDLKMTVRGEMELAYLGEIATPSRCGRLDQGCAYGDRPILMTFDGDRIDVDELRVGRDLHFVVADLNKAKDTREILASLNRCFPFAENEIHRRAQEYLGPINRRLVDQAARAIEEGDAERVGALMRQAQAEFDRCLIPACPSQLTSPHLHALLEYGPIQEYVLGGKGVGSQGDGSAQFLVRDAAAQEAVVAILERDLGMSCLKLVIPGGRRVRKALIPAAGFGTRLFPATKALKKEFFPVMGPDGRMKPVILSIVEEALSAGADKVGVVIQSRDAELFGNFFHKPPPAENLAKLSQENREYCRRLLEIGSRVELLVQDAQDGFGHAVHCGREFVGREPFLLLLGDHVYASSEEASCAAQVLAAFERTGKSAVGLAPVSADMARHFGCVAGQWADGGQILEITEFAEKPDAAYARERLGVTGLPPDCVYSLFGIYVLTPRVFEILADNIRREFREGGEFQLTSCLDAVRREEGFVGAPVRGRRFDVGNPEAYRQTLIDFPGS